MSALIVTAELAPADFAWFDRQRREHYPAERNRVPAHLTIISALPPSAEVEARRQLARIAAMRAPSARVAGVMNLGGGVAYRIASDELDALWEMLLDHFHGLLGPADAGGWRPHVTIQNKVTDKEARHLLRTLASRFRPRPLAVRALGLHRYAGGPWETLAVYPFRR